MSIIEFSKNNNEIIKLEEKGKEKSKSQSKEKTKEKK